MTRKVFEVEIWSSGEKEKLTAEILKDGEVFCLITQEEGLDRAEIEVFPRDSGGSWKCQLAELRSILETAITTLSGLTVDDRKAREQPS